MSTDLKRPIVIAIDGTSASGKSTNARLVAKRLGYIFVDTGAMYRTLAWYCLKKGIDPHDARAVANACLRWPNAPGDASRTGWRKTSTRATNATASARPRR